MAEQRPTLFLDNIFTNNSDSPSSVHIFMPYRSGKTREEAVDVHGLMIGDFRFQAQNKWGTVLHDLSYLQDFVSIAGGESMFGWVNASTMCWKGTSPLTFGIEFYLINYKRGLNLEGQLKQLVKLASLYRDYDAGALGENFKVLVHDGYAADILDGNSADSVWTKNINNMRDFTNMGSELLTGKNNIAAQLYDPTGNAKGSLTLQFGHKSTIRNILLSRIEVTESNVEVMDSSGGNVKPLYYRVSADFTGVRPLLSTDVDHMFNTRRSLS